MLKSKKWSFVSLMLIVILMFITACGGGNNAKPTTPATPTAETAPTEKDEEPEEVMNQEEITLTVFSMTANYAGEQTGWFAKILKDKFNVKLNIIASQLAGGQNKIATMMASGDLGDLVIYGNNGKDYQDSIKAGLLLDWKKDDLLEKHGQNILKNAGTAIEANMKQFGGGTAVYGIGSQVGSGDGSSEGVEMTYGPDLRWDLYQELGYPKIKTFNDYLSVLKQMQELEPKSESGRPTYGFSLWSDWDGNWMTMAKVIAQMHGYQEGDGFNPAHVTLFAVDEEKYQGMIDENSYYMQALKFYFDANQMGLFDPDSLTQTFGDVANKYRDGQILFSHFPWMGDSNYNTPERLAEGKGFALVPFEDERVVSYAFSPYGSNRPWAIGSKSKDPARVMQIIDYLFSHEGLMDTAFGPKGVTWDLDKDGKQFLTELGKQAMADGETEMPVEVGGSTYKDGISQISASSLHLSMINPITGEPFDYKMWTSVLKDNPNLVKANWQEKMGVLTPKEYFVKNNLTAVLKPVFTGTTPETPPADIQQKVGSVGKVLKEYSWKMIYAKDEAEFNKLKEEMVTKSKGLGYDEVVAWEVELAKNTVWAARKQ